MTTGHPACEQVHPTLWGDGFCSTQSTMTSKRLTNPPWGLRSVFANSVNYATTPLVVLEAPPFILLPLAPSFNRLHLVRSFAPSKERPEGPSWTERR